jgi:hypothetical protein
MTLTPSVSASLMGVLVIANAARINVGLIDSPLFRSQAGNNAPLSE